MALGDIGSLKDTFEHETTLLLQVTSVQVADGVVAVCYSGPDGDGFVSTIGVDAAGNITTPIIDQIEFELSSCFDPCFIHCHGNIYAVAYRRGANDVTLKTIEINPAGAITDTVKDTQAIDAALGYRPNLCMARDNWIAVFYENGAGDGVVRTLAIDAGGLIMAHQDECVIQSPVYGPTDMCQGSTGVVVTAHGGAASANITTVTVDSNGDMPATPIDTHQLSGNRQDHFQIIKIRQSESIFIISARITASSVGWIHAIDVDGSGNIGASTLSSRETAAEIGAPQPMRKVAEGMLVLCRSNALGELFVQTHNVNTGGGIAAPKDSINLGDQDVLQIDISPIIGDIWGVSFNGPDSDGFLKTIDIEGPAAAVGHVEMLMGIGP